MEKLTYTHNDAAAKALAAFYETPPLAYVRSYGCQQNVNDGEKIKGVLQDVGYGLCDNVEHADLILFNTCAVREHAEQRVFGNVGALKKLKEQNPRLMIGVCGCMAQQEHIVEKLRQSYPYVDLVFGVDGIDRLPAMLAERIRKGKRYLEKPAERNAVVEELPIRRDSGFRAWLPIMYGCDNFCTYCIVPYVRGRERSREPAAILAEFRQLVEQGYKEITLLGQNVNSYGEKIKGVLQDVGYGLCDNVEHADLILFNTCAVREHAEQRVFGNVGALKKLKEQNPRLMIGVCGCMAQQEHIVEKLRQSYPYVDLVFGVDGIDRLPAMLAERIRKGKRYLEKPAERNAVVEELPIRRDSGFRAWLPIMYGCDNFCTYCIVPYVRGRERSREPAAILAEFRQLVEQGYKEITLLGQNVNSYGKGLEHPIDFADLLNLLCEVPGDYQIRFMTSHPKDASRKLIDTIAAQEHLCKHIHLPVQSGSDRLLKEMNRHYNVAQYMDLIRYAKEKIPGVTFSSDIIVGFPGETEEDFAATLDLIREVGYMQLFTFIYSKRAGTPAAKLPDPTTHAEKAARMDRLLKTQEEFAFAATAAMAGRTVRVLVEAAGRNEGTVNGRLDNNLVVEFKAPESLIGQWADVHITGSRAALLVGELAE